MSLTRGFKYGTSSRKMKGGAPIFGLRKKALRMIRGGRRRGGRGALQRAYWGSKSSGYVDLTPATYAANTTGSVTLIATIAQGAAVTQRIGKKVILKGMNIRGMVYNDTTAGTSAASMLVVYDRRPTGALPVITDVLVSASPFAQNNNDNAGRFTVLAREDFVLQGNTGTAGQDTSSSSQSISRYVKMNKKAVYKALGTGAIGDIEEGALYLITVGNVVAGTADSNFTLGFRTKFRDIQG